MDGSSAASAIWTVRDALLARVHRRLAFKLAVERTPTVDQLASLRALNLITDEQHAAGLRWRRDWMAHAQGVMDGSIDAADRSPAQLARVKAGVRCQDVREGIGRVGEILLIMMLIDGNSPDAIAARPYPDPKDALARGRWRDDCITVIHQLTERYRVLDQPMHV